MSEKKRKISDIIISIEEKIDFLIKNFHAQNANIKILLSNLNNSDIKNISEKQKVQNSAKLVEVSGSESLKLKKEHAIQDDKNSQFGKMLESVENNSDISSPVIKRGDRTNTYKNNNIFVTQQIIAPNQKPLSLATIKIYDDVTGTPVKTARSNTKGKWTAKLYPGVYNIKIIRKYTSNPDKEPIEFSYKISIPNENIKTLDLPQVKV